MADVPVLVCTSGSLEGNRYTVLDGSELSIGRSDENNIVLTEDGVSRFHARLHNDNGALWLRDAGSRNGVFVNDLRVTDHHALRVGDVIRIAETEFTVRWLSDEEDTASFHGLPSQGGRWWWPFKS
ncbi:MAG: FHA domain-containing protein [Deltaproteobacteria bacterium]|nr:MAG: FHA domain-containing protein [Deltaproteobacteria bacterium]